MGSVLLVLSHRRGIMLPGSGVTIKAAICAARLAVLLATPVGEFQEKPPSAPLLNVAPSFALPDAQGTRHLSHEYDQGRGLVILFVSSESDTCRSYLPRLASLGRDFGRYGIHFLLIDVAPRLLPSTVEELYRSAGIKVPILHDAEHSVARWYNVGVVPTAYLLDAQRVVQYLGQIDNNANAKLVTRSPLRAALEAFCRGTEITEKQTLPFGSPVRRE